MNRPRLSGVANIYINAIELGLSIDDVGELYCGVYYDMIISKMYSNAVLHGKIQPKYKATQEDIDVLFGKED